MKQATQKLLRLHQLRTQLADVAARERSIAGRQLFETEQSAVQMHHHTRNWNAERTNANDSWRTHRASVDVAHRAHAVLLNRVVELRTRVAELQVTEQATAVARDQAGQLLSSRRHMEKIEEERRAQKEIDDLYAAARLRAKRATLL